MHNAIEEYAREWLATRVEMRPTAEDTQECLSESFYSRGIPKHIRSDNGPAFTSLTIRRWLGELEARRLFVEPALVRTQTSGASRQAAVRGVETGDFLYAAGSPGPDRAMAR